MQKKAAWNLDLNYSFSFCMALRALKFLKVFSFNKEISFLASTLSNCPRELFCFAFMFLTVWLAFVQLFYLFFQKFILEFSTMMRSMTTCFQIMLGKFKVESLIQADTNFGPIFSNEWKISKNTILLKNKNKSVS